MVAAAKADEDLSDAELDMIEQYDRASIDDLRVALQKPTDPASIAALAKDDQMAAEIYAVYCRVADGLGLNPAERNYLDRLAMAMRMDPELAARIETDVRTG